MRGVVRCVRQARPWTLACALLAGCAGAPQAPTEAPAPAPSAARPPAPSALEQFEQAQRERAEAAAQAGRLAAALWAWEVLRALRPARTDYHERYAAIEQQIQAAVAERLGRAQAAQRRGDLDGASAQYLAALALSPGHATAAEALRSIERERVRRTQLGKLSRNALMRPPAKAEAKPDARAEARPEPRADARGEARNGADRNVVEHASMLASQGELADAIALLQAHLANRRHDAEARRLLADLLEQQQRGAATRGLRPAASAPAAPSPVPPTPRR